MAPPVWSLVSFTAREVGLTVACLALAGASGRWASRSGFLLETSLSKEAFYVAEDGQARVVSVSRTVTRAGAWDAYAPGLNEG